MRPMFVRRVPPEDRDVKTPDLTWATGCRVCSYVDFAKSQREALTRAEVHSFAFGCSWEGEPVATKPQHDEDCAERCAHCEMCGVSVLYGSRCPEHPLPARALPC